MKAKSGFTLVEILIVVVILGILAAIIIPQFTNASTEAKESSLRTDLQTVRSQIELYKVQHTDTLPPAATFTAALTGYTNVAGTTVAQGTAGALGPYMQKIPTNQFNGLNTVGIDGTAGDSSHGWNFSTTTGVFSADDSNTHAAY